MALAKPVKYQTVPKAMSSNPTGGPSYFYFLSLLDVGWSLWDQSNARDLIGFIVAPELERSGVKGPVVEVWWLGDG